MKKLLVFIVALMASLTLSAQEMRYGVTGGVNFAWMHNPISSSDAYIGFNAGVKAEMDLSSVVADGFYADARALYSLKGGRWSGIHQNLGYLELPFNFGYRIDTGSDVGVLVGLGPYFGLGVLGKKVLIIDLDPQGNTTSGVGISKKGLKASTKELLSGELTAREIILETNYKNLSVIPTNTTLAGAEFDLFDFDESEFRMKNALAEVKDEYDYILIDCPPSLGMLTINAFAASDGVIVPMQCEFYALEGLSQLMITINRIKRLYNPELTVSGIIITMYNSRLLLSMQVIAELKKHYDDKIFDTKISRNVKLTEAPGFGKPAYYHDKSSKGSKEYMEVAKELITRI